jgi:hypothetical protein
MRDSLDSILFDRANPIETYRESEFQHLAINLYHVRITWCDKTSSKIPGDKVLTLRIQLKACRRIGCPDGTCERRLRLCLFADQQLRPFASDHGVEVGDVGYKIARYPEGTALSALWLAFIALDDQRSWVS